MDKAQPIRFNQQPPALMFSAAPGDSPPSGLGDCLLPAAVAERGRSAMRQCGDLGTGYSPIECLEHKMTRILKV